MPENRGIQKNGNSVFFQWKIRAYPRVGKKCQNSSTMHVFERKNWISFCFLFPILGYCPLFHVDSCRCRYGWHSRYHCTQSWSFTPGYLRLSNEIFSRFLCGGTLELGWQSCPVFRAGKTDVDVASSPAVYSAREAWRVARLVVLFASIFKPSATVSRIGLMESCVYRHCHGGIPPPTSGWPPLAGYPPPKVAHMM